MRALQLHGTVRKIQQLVRLSKQALREGAYRVANRLHAVALNMEGRTAPEIADLLKVHRSNVCLWLQRWQEQGVEGILEGHRAGRPPTLSELRSASWDVLRCSLWPMVVVDTVPAFRTFRP